MAQEARRRGVELRAQGAGGDSEAEQEGLRAVYAYEEVLFRKNGKRTRATRTWQMIKKHGVILAVEKAVCRKDETLGYTALADAGLQDFAFENVVLRHPDLFSNEAVAISKARASAQP